MSRIVDSNDIYNLELKNNVSPTGWKNPEPTGVYNLVVIGAGSAGLISSIATAALGGKVALIEKAYLGGDCLNYGCVPSKSLIRSSRMAYELGRAADYGLDNHAVSADWFGRVMERMRTKRARISQHDSAQRFKDAGVDVFLGEAEFAGEKTVTVAGQQLRFNKAVIASGARAAVSDIPGIAEVGYLTNENVFDLVELPERLIVLGGGPIGCELAQAFSRLGSKVSIIQHRSLLSREDADASGIIYNVFKNEGIEVYTDSEVLKAGTEDGKKVITIKKDGCELSVSGDEILVAVGRKPNVEGLGLENVGVEYDSRRGIKVDDYLRTTNRRIFAAGDCCMRWKFTHAADAAAQIAIQNALFHGRKRLSSLVMPWTTYTDPEVAHVGMSEREAVEKSIQYDCYKVELTENDRAVLDGEERGFAKVLVKKGSDKIIGATIVAKHAGEMISELTLCMVGGIGLGKLGGVIHPYPTQAEAIKRVAGEYNKTRLTPAVARMMKWWFRIQRW